VLYRTGGEHGEATVGEEIMWCPSCRGFVKCFTNGNDDCVFFSCTLQGEWVTEQPHARCGPTPILNLDQATKHLAYELWRLQ
jgi:hypothetical protein